MPRNKGIGDVNYDLEPLDWAFRNEEMKVAWFKVELTVSARDEAQVFLTLQKVCELGGLGVSDIAIMPKEEK